MSSEPLVTIVTPSLNQGQFIRATIESVLSQDYPGVEYIVMDGGSTDETASVVKDYSSRLTFISKPDKGQSNAINEGFLRGRGEILAWLNSDDIYVPGSISAAVRAFSANPGCGMVYGEGYVISRNGEVQGRFPHSRSFDLWRLVHLSDYILQQGSYFRRAALDEVGYLDEKLQYGMDWDVFIRIGMRFPVCYIPEYLGCIREYSETKTSSGGLIRAHELHSMLRKHTGMRLPPGSIVYCGETYLKLARSWLDRVPSQLGFFSKIARKAVDFGAGIVIGRTIHHAQNLYDDGWAGDRLRFMLPAGQGCFEATGSIPASAAHLHGQTITVRANGLPLGEFPIPVGDFQIEIPAPGELHGQPLRLEIKASRFFRAAPLKGDFRRLAFVLNHIQWL
ncbi:MAG TPA: glycosyltransferase family 2 protein [Bryobacteraceae bacterium]|jgi:glycosyltransferase involved in cell wall biosynthesis|nr:glycosyltransferase family 2 protein [Bryobacteraceae bacterium]